jgi:hypothetical protein
MVFSSRESGEMFFSLISMRRESSVERIASMTTGLG